VRFAVLAVAICSVLAGCGGVARPTRAGDSRLGKASLITLHDLPAGWSGDDQHLRNEVACGAVKTASAAANAVATSDVFSHGGNAQAEFAVYVFPDAARAGRAFRAIASQSTRACLGARLAEAVKSAKGVTHVGEPKTGPETVRTVGDRQAGSHIVIEFSNGKLDRDFYADLTAVGTSRGLSLGLFVDVENPFDERLLERLTAVQANRLSRSLARH
jgi:hypothetical protein